MANRTEIEFRDGGIRIFDGDPDLSVVWVDDQVKVQEGNGDIHWFNNVSGVWNEWSHIPRFVTVYVDRITTGQISGARI